MSQSNHLFSVFCIRTRTVFISFNYGSFLCKITSIFSSDIRIYTTPTKFEYNPKFQIHFISSDSSDHKSGRLIGLLRTTRLSMQASQTYPVILATLPLIVTLLPLSPHMGITRQLGCLWMYRLHHRFFYHTAATSQPAASYPNQLGAQPSYVSSQTSQSRFNWSVSHSIQEEKIDVLEQSLMMSLGK